MDAEVVMKGLGLRLSVANTVTAMVTTTITATITITAITTTTVTAHITITFTTIITSSPLLLSTPNYATHSLDLKHRVCVDVCV